MEKNNNNYNIFAYNITFFDDEGHKCYVSGITVSATMRLAAEKLYDFFNGAIQRMELTCLDPQDKNTDIYIKEHREWCI